MKLQARGLIYLGVKVILKMTELKIIYCFSHSCDTFKQFLMLLKLQHGYQKNFLMRVLNLLQRLIIVLIQGKIILIMLEYK